MQTLKVDPESLNRWVDGLIRKRKVIGVKARGDGFVFDRLTASAELRLDYDITRLPPKKHILPQIECLTQCNTSGQCREVTDTDPFVLFGVHTYDMAAIHQMDAFYTTGVRESGYIARRQSATIVVLDPLRPSKNTFASSMGTTRTQEGGDIILTAVEDGYVAESLTAKGEDLLADLKGAARATPLDLAARERARARNEASFNKHTLRPKLEELPDLVEKSLDHPVWEEMSRNCFSCGSCNLVCPTCYCFDVQDQVAWDLKSAARHRSWDGCLLVDFAAVSGNHNFRKEKKDRFRHRFFRKAKYIHDRLGHISCVGCGRCVTACVAGIANPVDVYNHLWEDRLHLATATAGPKPPPLSTEEREPESYAPRLATVLSNEPMTENENLFRLALDSGKPLGHRPGQFVEVSLPGYGESPISVSSDPDEKDYFELGVRRVGNVTLAMHRLKPGDKLGIRGPFGKGFPVDGVMKGKDLVFLAGGCGLVPVRSAIKHVLNHRADYGRVTILFGCKSHKDRLYVHELKEWESRPDVVLKETVDLADEKWKGNVGVITTLLPQIQVTDRANTLAIVCGPPVMYKFVIASLRGLGFEDRQIIVSLERRMKCGLGKCGHCQINGLYACQDGPVFNLADLAGVTEALS